MEITLLVRCTGVLLQLQGTLERGRGYFLDIPDAGSLGKLVASGEPHGYHRVMRDPSGGKVRDGCILHISLVTFPFCVSARKVFGG